MRDGSADGSVGRRNDTAPPAVRDAAAHDNGAHARRGVGGTDAVHGAAATVTTEPGTRGWTTGCHRGPLAPGMDGTLPRAVRPSVPGSPNANVLPHLTSPERKVEYLAHLIGVLLNHLFVPACRASQQYDATGAGKWQIERKTFSPLLLPRITCPRDHRLCVCVCACVGFAWSRASGEQAHRCVRHAPRAANPERRVPDARIRSGMKRKFDRTCVSFPSRQAWSAGWQRA